MRPLATAAFAMLLTMPGVARDRESPPGRGPLLVAVQMAPVGVMGTSCNLVAVTDPGSEGAAGRVLAAADAELRRLEALLSTWIQDSPISRFNRAPAGLWQPLPEDVLIVLLAARDLHRQTEGAFDITARPLIELWRAAGRNGGQPTSEALATARQASLWDHVRLGDGKASKTLSSTTLDIDGLAKGYAIDLALALIEKAGARGGMVEVGGDLRVFGSPPGHEAWSISIRSPFEDRAWAEIRLAEGAVCTSGDYARYHEIGGRRRSHIVDPRTGMSSEATRTVTVVGRDAISADAWATALSVLGPEGLELLRYREDLQAMIVSGQADEYRVHATPGFEKLLVRAEFAAEK